MTFPPHQFDFGSAAIKNPQCVLILHQFFSNLTTPVVFYKQEDLTMRKSMRLFSIALAAVMTGGLFLGMAPAASAQRIRGRVVIVGPGPFYGPFYPYYGYYPYPPSYMAANYGEV